MSSSIEYVSQVEIEERHAIMRQLVEDNQRAHEAIIDRRDRKIEAAMHEADGLLDKLKKSNTKKLRAMQRDLKQLPLLRRVYHEAPNNVFELM
jgi:hypothetical protein